MESVRIFEQTYGVRVVYLSRSGKYIHLAPADELNLEDAISLELFVAELLDGDPRAIELLINRPQFERGGFRLKFLTQLDPRVIRKRQLSKALVSLEKWYGSVHRKPILPIRRFYQVLRPFLIANYLLNTENSWYPDSLDELIEYGHYPVSLRDTLRNLRHQSKNSRLVRLPNYLSMVYFLICFRSTGRFDTVATRLAKLRRRRERWLTVKPDPSETDRREMISARLMVIDLELTRAKRTPPKLLAEYRELGDPLVDEIDKLIRGRVPSVRRLIDRVDDLLASAEVESDPEPKFDPKPIEELFAYFHCCYATTIVM